MLNDFFTLLEDEQPSPKLPYSRRNSGAKMGTIASNGSCSSGWIFLGEECWPRSRATWLDMEDGIWQWRPTLVSSISCLGPPHPFPCPVLPSPCPKEHTASSGSFYSWAALAGFLLALGLSTYWQWPNTGGMLILVALKVPHCTCAIPMPAA